MEVWSGTKRGSLGTAVKGHGEDMTLDNLRAAQGSGGPLPLHSPWSICSARLPRPSHLSHSSERATWCGGSLDSAVAEPVEASP